MSVAFAKEDSAETASETMLPPREISGRINLVTETGLTLLKAALAQAEEALEAANRIEDVNERRRQSAVPVRDARYFAERLRTADLRLTPDSDDVVAFGHRVTFARSDGRVQTYQIVGEDEADPSKGTLSHGSPVALALFGRAVGDVVRVGPQELEVVAIA